jgi:hypothetical protein
MKDRDSLVLMTTDYGLDDPGSIPSRERFSSQRQDRFWGPPTILTNGYWELFPRG